MLSDEEKAVLKTAKENYGLTSVEQGILVNLIEKQQKEIEKINYIKRSFDYCVEQEIEKLNKSDTSKEQSSMYYYNLYEKLVDKIKAKIEEKFLEAKGLYERGVQPQAQYTMKLLRDLEKSLLEKE